MKITEKIHYVGVNDRQKALFEGLWPLPNGVSYNSYLISDTKVCLVDTVEVTFFSQFLEIHTIITHSKYPKIVRIAVSPNRMCQEHMKSITLIYGQLIVRPLINNFGQKIKESSIKGTPVFCLCSIIFIIWDATLNTIAEIYIFLIHGYLPPLFSSSCVFHALTCFY